MRYQIRNTIYRLINSFKIIQLASGGKYLIAAFCTPKATTPAAIPAQEKAGILKEKRDPSPNPYDHCIHPY